MTPTAPLSPTPIRYRLRPYTNADVPDLVQLWNRGMREVTCALPIHVEHFERFILSKLYFDRRGITVAERDDQIIGMVHAGFGPDESETLPDHTKGTIALVCVDPIARRRGIATELVGAAEQYLIAAGTRQILFGSVWPVVPFYLGLYGGSDMPGVLESTPGAVPFAQSQGYRSKEKRLVYRRHMGEPLEVGDLRFRDLRKRLRVDLMDRFQSHTRWRCLIYNVFEGATLVATDRESGREIARAAYWNMSDYMSYYQWASAGVVDVWVEPEWRRQGVGKLLMLGLLQFLNENFYGIVETQVPETNTAAVRLFEGVGFQRVDAGLVFQKDVAD